MSAQGVDTSLRRKFPVLKKPDWWIDDYFEKEKYQLAYVDFEFTLIIVLVNNK